MVPSAGRIFNFTKPRRLSAAIEPMAPLPCLQPRPARRSPRSSPLLRTGLSLLTLSPHKRNLRSQRLETTAKRGASRRLKRQQRRRRHGHRWLLAGLRTLTTTVVSSSGTPSTRRLRLNSRSRRSRGSMAACLLLKVSSWTPPEPYGYQNETWSRMSDSQGAFWKCRSREDCPGVSPGLRV